MNVLMRFVVGSLALLAWAERTSGYTIQIMAAAQTEYGIGTGGPGLSDSPSSPTSVALDFTGGLGDIGQVFDISFSTIIFDAGTIFDQLHVRLSDQSEYVFDTPSPNSGQIAGAVYDPSWINAAEFAGATPSGLFLMSDAWAQEMMDGVFEADIWVTNPSVVLPQYAWWHFGSSTAFVMPEPGSLALLGTGAVALILTRRRGRS